MAWSWQGVAPEATTLSVDGVRWATLVPMTPTFVPAPCEILAGRAYVLSRFTFMRAEGGTAILESPRAHARIVLDDWRAAAVIHLLSVPRRLEDPELASIAGDGVRGLLALLLAARMASEASADGGCAEDEASALRSWEFHDLLVHTRARGGRHDHPFGATYRFLGDLAPPAPLPASTATEPTFALFRPDLQHLEETDPPFARVQEARRSIREYDARPLSAAQLGEFLYRVGRVADWWQEDLPTPRETVRLAAATRPYPAGGGLYELDLYVVVNRCDGLATGLYRYDAERHCLRPCVAVGADLDALLADASFATAVPREQLQVLIVVAAHFQRIAWKYASIAYSIVLKNVGVLYDTMYLAATAMGLAPCGIGGGNSDLFARAAGLDYYVATSVGEFLLGSRAIEPRRQSPAA